MNQYRRDFAGAAGLKPPFLYSGLAENDRHINKKLNDAALLIFFPTYLLKLKSPFLLIYQYNNNLSYYTRII